MKLMKGDSRNRRNIAQTQERRLSRGVASRMQNRPALLMGLLWGLLWGFLLCTTPLSGRQAQSQQPQASPPIKVDVKVVNIVASVRDKKGQIVTNLAKDAATRYSPAAVVKVR